MLEPDLAGPGAAARWPWFAPEAAAIGAGAVFAFPLQVGRMVFGVLWFYRRARGGLGGWDLSAALGMAQTAAAVVLNDIAEHSREQLDAHFTDSVFGRRSIDQALGVIAAQRHSRYRAGAGLAAQHRVRPEQNQPRRRRRRALTPPLIPT